MDYEKTVLPQRHLGSQGLQVGAIGLGTMGMTVAYGDSDTSRSEATIRRAYELGVTLFDTAEMLRTGRARGTPIRHAR